MPPPAADDTGHMNTASRASAEYVRNAVLTASPEQLHLMLLDGAIRFSLRGRDAIEHGDVEGTFNALERAQRIVLELFNGMRREVNPPLVDQMAALYDFIYRRLIDANVHGDARAVDDALRILRHQRETWEMLIDRISREGARPAAVTRTVVTPVPSGADVAPEPLSVEG